MGIGGSHQKSSSGPSPEQRQRIGLQNQYAGGLYGTGQSIFGEMNPVLVGELNNPLTPQEQGSLTRTALEPVASTFESAADTDAQRAARTRNAAGLLSAEDRLAREKGQAMSGAASKALVQGMNIATQRRQDALATLARLYGVDMETMGRLIGTMPSPSSSGSAWKFGVQLPSPSPSG